MRIASLTIHFGFFLLTQPLFAAGPDDAYGVIRKLIESRTQVFEVTKVRMKIFDDKGSEKNEQKLFEISTHSPDKDSFRSLIVFKEPANIKGAKVLTTSRGSVNGQWLYLPSSKKVIRMNGDNDSDSIFESDLSYADLKGENLIDYSYSFGDARLTEYATKQCQEPAHAIMAVTKSGVSSSYSKRLISISQSREIVCDVLAYNKQNVMVKRIQNQGFKQYSSRWRPSLSIVQTLGKGQKVVSKTELSFYEWSLGKKVDESVFSPDSLNQ